MKRYKYSSETYLGVIERGGSIYTHCGIELVYDHEEMTLRNSEYGLIYHVPYYHTGSKFLCIM